MKKEVNRSSKQYMDSLKKHHSHSSHKTRFQKKKKKKANIDADKW